MSSSTYILSVARSDLYTQIFDRIEVGKLLVVHILCLLYLRLKHPGIHYYRLQVLENKFMHFFWQMPTSLFSPYP
jgi:succinate dehydrogenase hydrophobic anchor subunit